MREWYCKVNETPGKQEGGTMKVEKAIEILRHTAGGGISLSPWIDEKEAAQLGVKALEQMLTLEEARELLHCWKNESASRYGKVNRQAPLYLKLKGMVEGQ